MLAADVESVALSLDDLLLLRAGCDDSKDLNAVVTMACNVRSSYLARRYFFDLAFPLLSNEREASFGLREGCRIIFWS